MIIGHPTVERQGTRRRQEARRRRVLAVRRLSNPFGKLGGADASAEQLEAQRLQAEKAERDRAIAAERNAQLRLNEARAQVRQIVEAHKVKREGEIAYRFTDGDTIRSVLVNEALRAQLASGTLVVVRHDQGYELLPRAAADKVYARDAAMIVLDHGRSTAAGNDNDDEYYKQFQVPDDLIW